VKPIKKLDTVVEDIYSSIEDLGKGKPIKVSEEDLDKFGDFMKEAMKDWLTPRANRKPSLRMSNIGKPERQLWYEMKSDPKDVAIPAPTMIKFLYGHILERVVLFLTELSGHEVTDEQKEVRVEGIVGHMDCKIDGEVVDIKSASNFAFKKFSEGTLPQNDPFGYLSQLAGYEYNEETSNGAFLTINKESGDLVVYCPSNEDKPDIKSKINKIQKQLKQDTPPPRCYKPVDDGAYGNQKLPRECKYCSFKFECHKDANDGVGLRVFQYHNELRYLTKVEKLPKVDEVTARFNGAT
jgi:hypothetical protein